MRYRISTVVAFSILAVLTAASRVWRRVVLPAAIAALFILLAPIGPVWLHSAAEATVVTTHADDGSHCSLRDAINNANAGSDTTGGWCPLSAGDTFYHISFAISPSTTITLTSDLPGITGHPAPAVTIDGTNGAGQITVDGASKYGSFQIRKLPN